MTEGRGAWPEQSPRSEAAGPALRRPLPPPAAWTRRGKLLRDADRAHDRSRFRAAERTPTVEFDDSGTPCPQETL